MPETGPSNSARAARRELIRRIPLFARLEEPQVEQLANVARIQRIAAREELFHKGDAGGQVYVIVNGRLKVGTTSPDGASMVFHIMDSGEVFGELALLSGGVRSGTVTALEDSELLVLDRRDFLHFLHEHPAAAVDMLGLLAERVVRVSEQVENTVFLNLPARLARKLVDLADSYGESEGGEAASDSVAIGLNISQGSLGEMVGTSRESINKQIKIWEREGLLDMSQGRVTIHRLQELERLAGLLDQ